MTKEELISTLTTLAKDCQSDNPMAAGVLFCLAGSISAGPEWQMKTYVACAALSQEFIQFVTGEGETRQ